MEICKCMPERQEEAFSSFRSWLTCTPQKCITRRGTYYFPWVLFKKFHLVWQVLDLFTLPSPLCDAIWGNFTILLYLRPPGDLKTWKVWTTICCLKVYLAWDIFSLLKTLFISINDNVAILISNMKVHNNNVWLVSWCICTQNFIALQSCAGEF